METLAGAGAGAAAGAPVLRSCRLPRHSINAAALHRVSCQLASPHRLFSLLPPALLLSHRYHCHTHRRKSAERLPCCIQASSAITFHVENTTITVPLSQAAAVGLSKAIEDVLNTFREKEKAQKPRRWESMEFRHTEDGVFVEFFCNPNAYANPFQAKVLLTLSDEKMKITSEGQLIAIKTYVDQYVKAFV